MPNQLSPEPQVQIAKAFPTPFTNVIATARTCYSSKGIITDDDVVPFEKWEPLAKSIYEAGHHTTFQHAYFQFTLSNVSRQFIWSFLHSHPFYNSEQVSQRYVKIKTDGYYIPPIGGEALKIYTDTIGLQTDAYFRMIELLHDVTAGHYFDRFPARKHRPEKYGKDIVKKCQEIARYVMPVATFAYLYHTISAVTLLRYYRLVNQFDAPHEQRTVIGKMVDALLAHDPLYKSVLEEPLPIEETPEARFFTELGAGGNNGRDYRRQFIGEFDGSLEGKVSKLIDWKINNEKVLASSVREVYGMPESMLPDDDAIEMVLHPGRNTLLGESLVLTTHSKLSRALFNVHYTFRKKLSHTADSQDQRHRMTPASRPILSKQITDTPDYITPGIITEDARAFALYSETMSRTWENIQKLLQLGVDEGDAVYLLPNAVSVRFTESADLLNLHHKHAMRLCYNAQEEIWRASLDEAQQIRAINPRIGKYLLPPCTIRDLANRRPVCPEGQRFCGEKVWRLDIEDYERVL
jgi:thymidylate synthase ThyX